jgi:hypothetical protein
MFDLTPACVQHVLIVLALQYPPSWKTFLAYNL